MAENCRHCGSSEYYLTIRVSGKIVERHHFSDNSLGENSELWDSATLVPQKTARCNGCHRKVEIAKQEDRADG